MELTARIRHEREGQVIPTNTSLTSDSLKLHSFGSTLTRVCSGINPFSNQKQNSYKFARVQASITPGVQNENESICLCSPPPTLKQQYVSRTKGHPKLAAWRRLADLSASWAPCVSAPWYADPLHVNTAHHTNQSRIRLLRRPTRCPVCTWAERKY